LIIYAIDHFMLPLPFPSNCISEDSVVYPTTGRPPHRVYIRRQPDAVQHSCNEDNLYHVDAPRPLLHIQTSIYGTIRRDSAVISVPAWRILNIGRGTVIRRLRLGGGLRIAGVMQVIICQNVQNALSSCICARRHRHDGKGAAMPRSLVERM